MILCKFIYTLDHMESGGGGGGGWVIEFSVDDNINTVKPEQ